MQARNIMGYGPMSDVLTVVAGVPPDSPNSPPVEVSDVGLYIDWQKPAYEGGGLLRITGYDIIIFT